ncbi:ATP synthase subunit G atp20 [Tieghemiomyces parasiticus]|uniref:ATP synthase subunit G atp20 n=1 Tax=Tieghemiomyces parasiticus TaxID=78921 RepID=A0A9W8AG79_9FUNG|nr:ATP synthase subunit G atp20 [Tieghemiomyces parasiticus]KAJ1929379.1 ATP synthase subunit G atp20 [Tieghemiomyces parasiticus]
MSASLFTRASTAARQLTRNVNTQELLDKSKVYANKAGVLMSNQASSLAKSAQGLSPKIGGFVDCTTYWAKVTKELAKQVYTKEQLAPPSLAEYQPARKELLKLFKTENLKNITRQDAVKATVVAIEVAGFFMIGEIIGRRNLVGYNV